MSEAAMAAPSDGIGSLAIDGVTRHAFVLDSAHHYVDIFDASGASLTPLGVIPIPAVFPVAQALNETTHHLFVLDGPGEQVFEVDVDPASATTSTVLNAWATGGKGAHAITVDSLADVVYVANADSDDVSVIDVGSGAVRHVPAGQEPGDIVADSSTQHAYVASTVDSTITTIFPTGSSTVHVDDRPLRLAFGGGVLLVSTDRPYAVHIESYDPRSMSKLATSKPLGAYPNDIAVDEDRHLVFIVSAAGGIAGILTLRSDSLAAEDAGPEDYFNSIAVDRATQHVVVTETPRGGPERSHVVMFESHVSPLPSVDRTGGADRFAVSAAISASTFDSGVPVVYIACGTGFADALSGSAAAGRQRGPVLLVTKDEVPSAVSGELARLRPQRIVVLGGTASVSASVQTQLGSFSRSVTRIAGADRYDVSAAVSQSAFSDGADVVYVASGQVFPDALSGAPAAGHDRGPVLLVQKDAIPDAVRNEIARLKAKNIVVLGGMNTIAGSVLDDLGAVAPVTRVDGPDRYSVSAAVSPNVSPVRAYTVYVASGETFPDALSGAAAAIADDAPVLLVSHDSLPQAVADQLARMHPYRIVVLGGSNTISDGVVSQLASYLPE